MPPAGWYSCDPQRCEGPATGAHQHPGALAVSDAGGRDHAAQHEVLRFHDQVALAPADVLATIVPVRTPYLVVLTLWLPSTAPEVVVGQRLGRQVVRQVAPGAAVAGDVADGVNDLGAGGRGARPRGTVKPEGNYWSDSGPVLRVAALDPVPGLDPLDQLSAAVGHLHRRPHHETVVLLEDLSDERDGPSSPVTNVIAAGPIRVR